MNRTYHKLAGNSALHSKTPFEVQLDQLERLLYKPDDGTYAALAATLHQSFDENDTLFEVWQTFLALISELEKTIGAQEEARSHGRRYYDDCIKFHNALTQGITRTVDSTSRTDPGISVQDLYAISIRYGFGGKRGVPGFHVESPVFPLIQAYREAMRRHTGEETQYSKTQPGLHHCDLLRKERAARLLLGEDSIIHKAPKRPNDDQRAQLAQQRQTKRPKDRGGPIKKPKPTSAVDRANDEDWSSINNPRVWALQSTFDDLIYALSSAMNLRPAGKDYKQRCRALLEALTEGTGGGIGFDGPGRPPEELYRLGVTNGFVALSDTGRMISPDRFDRIGPKLIEHIYATNLWLGKAENYMPELYGRRL